MGPIEKIHLVHLNFSEHKEVQELMRACYPQIENPTWNKEQIQKLTKIFPDGQISMM